MTRNIRILIANGTYSVSTYGLSELTLFKDIIDKANFIQLIEKYAITYHINIYGYTFSENSVEIMLHDPKCNLSIFMKCVKGTYSQHYYNIKYDRKGTIYKDRFKSNPIKDYIHYNVIKNIIGEKLPINDGSLVNFNLDWNIVFDIFREHFNLNGSKLLLNNQVSNSDYELNHLSLLVFSLRSFCGFIHKKISRLINGISETMSSTLSLNGVKLIMSGKYRDFYFKLLMIIYSDKRNCVYIM